MTAARERGDALCAGDFLDLSPGILYHEPALMIQTLLQRSARGALNYLAHLRAFSINARLYLVNAVITGASMGVFRFLLNFYVLSFGYNREFVGNLVTASSLTALIVALPMGYLADRLGRKTSLITGGTLTFLAVFAMVIWPERAVLISMNILLGLAQSLAGVTMGPFLMENSSDRERTYLFSYSSGLSTLSAFAGNWIGGSLPTWMGNLQGLPATSSSAYAASLAVIGAGAALAVLPLLFMRAPRLPRAERAAFAPFAYVGQHAGQLSRLIAPMLMTSLGAGLIIPFMNIFFREVHRQSDATIGAMFAWSSLAMGVGLMIAPPLAERYGKIQLVVVTQLLSIPFLILLGFAPWFWVSAGAYYIRAAFMNLSGPVYQTFVMEKVDQSARATVASLVSMAGNFGWAFSPTLSGWLQERYGFSPPFLGTIFLYLLSIYLYWRFFWPDRRDAAVKL